MSASIGFRILKKDKELIDKKIEDYANDRGLQKGDAFVRIMKDYFSTDHFIDDGDSESIDQVLDVIECSYIKVVDGETFACFEMVHKQKTPKTLGLISETLNVIELCRSCQERKIELHNLQIQKELRKVNIQKLEKFMKHYTQITIDGREVTTKLCLGDTASSALIFSYDGEYLPCPLQMREDEEGIEYKETVNIETTCKMKINPETRKTPCEYFTIIPHLVTIKDILKDDIEFGLDPWVDEDYPFLKALEEKEESIEADFKVIEGEEIEEKEDGT